MGRHLPLIAPVAIVAAMLAAPASAETLRDALAKAYHDNPTITGARAQQRANDENVPIAKAAGRPGVSATGSMTDNLVRSGNSFTTPARIAQLGVSLNVPVYSGGAVRNSIRAAETRVEAGQASLRGTEAATFTNVVSAYNNVLRDEAIVGLNAQNVKVLETNLTAARDRFQVGDLTRTDVAQSEARLSLARAQMQTAQANLIASRENYVELVGEAPGTLEPPPHLPDSPDTAVDVALTQNPTLLAAQRQRDATRYDVKVAQASRLPTVSVGAGENATSYLGSLGAGTGLGVGQSGASTSVGVNLRVPIFQAGDRRYAFVLCDLAVGAAGDPVVGSRGQRESAVAGGRSRRKQRRQPHDPRYPQCRAGIAQQPGHAGDGAPRRLCRGLRAARGDGQGGSARSRAGWRPALQSGGQL